jgi:hypothetical protein
MSAGVARGVGRAHPWWSVAAIVAVYAAVVAYTAAHHEPWRDEVVPMSFAKGVASLGELWEVLRYQGHPILWYLVLRGAYLVFGTTTVLPVASVVIAVAAVAVLLALAPLPLWVKALVAFGYFPIFEYSVIARGNGLAMLLLFAFCAFYVRGGSPIAAAAALAVLANTTVLGFVVAVAAGAMAVVDGIVDARRARDARDRVRPTRRHLAAGVVYLAGLVHVAASNSPGTAVFPAAIGWRDVEPILSALGWAIVNPVAHSAFLYWVPVPGLWIWLLLAVVLRRRPAVVVFALLALVGFEMIFALVYPASPRHGGYVLMVVLATLWLSEVWRWSDAPAEAGHAASVERWTRKLLILPLVLALGYQVVLGAGYVVDDVQLEYSSSRRLAELIASDPRLDRAIVIGEPEALHQTVPYYRDNPIYFPQEQAFRDWMWSPSVSFSVANDSTRSLQIGRRADYDLGELLRTATELRDAHGVPVVMALGWFVDGPETQRAYVGTWYEQLFTVKPPDRDAFLAQTQFLGRLRSASFTDENYDVFVLW